MNVELATQAQALDQCLVTRGIFLLEIAEQAATLVDHHQQTAAGVMILLVHLEMLGQVVDAGGEQRHLDFRGAEPPSHVVVNVTYTEPGVQGDTATRTLKNATIETGAEIKVPLFVNTGDNIKVKTTTGEYVERVK